MKQPCTFQPTCLDNYMVLSIKEAQYQYRCAQNSGILKEQETRCSKSIKCFQDCIAMIRVGLLRMKTDECWEATKKRCKGHPCFEDAE